MTKEKLNQKMNDVCECTDEMLENLEKIMSHTIDTAGTRYNNFINSIQSCYDIVTKNRRELSPQLAPSSYQTKPDVSEEDMEEDKAADSEENKEKDEE